MKDIFFLTSAKEVKNGRGTRFWEDKWCTKTPLKFSLDLHRVALDPSAPVIAHWTGEGWDFKVPWQFREILLPRIKDMLASLPDVLLGVGCQKITKDKPSERASFQRKDVGKGCDWTYQPLKETLHRPRLFQRKTPGGLSLLIALFGNGQYLHG